MRKTSRWFALACLAAIALASLQAQTPVLMTSGYSGPTPIQVAPGQILTLYLSGAAVQSNPSVQATSMPLPAMLAGFSVTLRQGNSSYSAPLLSVVQTADCTDADQTSPACIVTALTLQVPFDLAGVPILINAAQSPADLSVSENGTPSVHFPLAVTTDNIHILTACDVQPGFPLLPSPCPALVTHADGSLVSSGSPAAAGETVVLYAYGLGATIPAVNAGAVTPIPAPGAANAFQFQFDFRPNARASIPYVTAGRAPTPQFVGLTPGQVGLYQINVPVPSSVPAIPACTGVFSCLGSLIGCIIQSNATINISGVSSFDGAAICVAPPQ